MVLLSMGKINKDDQVLIMVIVICQMAPLYFPKLIQINYDSMLRMINVKTYQFKTHCKGDSHSSKTANIILPGLMIKQR